MADRPKETRLGIVRTVFAVAAGLGTLFLVATKVGLL